VGLTQTLRSRRDALTLWNRLRLRKKLAHRYITGTGIEIGALHEPLSLPPGAHAKYLDRLTTSQLREEYPAVAHLPLVEVDIVEDGEDPQSIEDGSLDFVIASHMIEHCEDPVGTIGNWLRILRPGGIIFLVVPDRRRTFDQPREPTSTDHLLQDHREGPAVSHTHHYREWVDAVHPESEDPDHLAADLDEQGYRIHFHVWSPAEFRDSVETFAREEQMPLKVVAVGQNYREFMLVAEKT